ncbi:MAG TPA: phosphoribosylamine--glycine ligase [Tepidisphaeraceae bacterium]|jgi:phosphoribosylamine--glycine ligase|nr:phosphoribosylamine--glycine ligase [Tepidisphaeraceae bacterium]
MTVLIIGSGGREHALAWKLAGSTRVTDLFCAPGNPGIGELADLVPIAPTDLDGIAKFVRNNAVDLVVIGPEDPLALGLADRLRDAGVMVFGPSKAAAQIESDKWFAKEIMRHQAIPTAETHTFTDPAAADEYVKGRDDPVVIKAAGLAKGKGVTICYRPSDALEAIDVIMRQKRFGDAGKRIVIEELLSGPECSVLAFVDKHTIYMLEPAQDHKPIDDGDTGPMTGGMGAYSPTPVVSPQLLTQIERDIFVPIVDGMFREGIEYQGCLYAGLMLTPNGPKVLEFNCRFGDPETQPLMMRLQTDLLEVLIAMAEGKLDQIELTWDPRPALCVVATSKGYPGEYTGGVPITGIPQADAMPDVKVFHSGTKLQGKTLVTDGGRVLGVTALGATVMDARRRAYAALEKIKFDGMHYRKDIGWQALKS